MHAVYDTSDKSENKSPQWEMAEDYNNIQCISTLSTLHER